MIKIFLLMGLLSHAIIVPQQSTDIPAQQPPQKQMIDRWIAQVTTNLVRIAQEAQKANPPVSEIVKLYEEINKTLYRIATLNNDLYQDLSKKRNDVIEQATQSIKKNMIRILQSAHEDAKKISYKDFFIGSKINQFMEAAKDILLKIDAVLVMAKIVFIQKDIERDKEARKTINGLFGKIANQIHILFSLIVNRIPQQPSIMNVVQFNFDRLLTYWKKYLQAINKSSLVHPPLLINTYEKELAIINTLQAEIKEIGEETKKLHYSLDEMKDPVFLTSEPIKRLMLTYEDYSRKLTKLLQHYQQLAIANKTAKKSSDHNSLAQFEKEHEGFEQEIKKVLVLALLVQMEEIEKTLKTVQSFDIHQLEAVIKKNKASWNELSQKITALTKIYYAGGDHLKNFPPPAAVVQELKKSFYTLEALFANILSIIQKAIMVEKSDLPYALTQTIPTFYGRIMGQYEKIMRIFAHLDPSIENKLGSFQKMHTQIIKKSNELEQQA